MYSIDNVAVVLLKAFYSVEDSIAEESIADSDCHDSGTLLKLPLALSALPGTAAVSPLSSLVTVSVGICIYVRRYKHV